MDKQLDRTKLTTKLYLQHQVKSTDSQFGTPARNWEDCKQNGKKVWVNGRVETLDGDELERARRKVATATHRVTIPALSFLNEKHRFVVAKNQRILEIGFINDVDMAGVKMICLCEETIARPGH